MANQGKIRAVLVGSSFVNRLRSDIASHAIFRSSTDFGIKECSVRFVSKGGWHIRDLSSSIGNIVADSPQVVFIHVGGNDIAEGAKGEVIADKLMQLAQSLVQRGVHRVYISELPPRFRGKYIPSLELETEIQKQLARANSFLRVVSQDREPAIKFWAHRYLNPTRSPEVIMASDGVHLSQLGQQRFYRSVRGAIIHALRH